jgi:hypothetical protein
MKNVQIRDVPDDIHAILVHRAESEKKSLQVFLSELLERESRKAQTREFLLQLARKKTGPEIISKEDLVDMIRAGRESR